MPIDARWVKWDDPTPDGIASLVTEEAKRQGVPVELALSLVRQESGGRQSALSPKGAMGVMQLMPGTAKELGVDPRDPVQNVRGGITYLKQQLDKFGSPELALAAYNAGPGAVQKAGGVPNFPETQNYVKSVMAGAKPAPLDPNKITWDEPAKPAEAQSSIVDGVKGAIGGVLRGLRDPIDAGAQMLVRGANAIGLAPDSEVARVDAINKSAEQDYRQNWRGGRDVGFDAARLVGNIGATVPMAAALPVGGGLAARTAISAASGAGFGALQPVENTDNFWAEKGKQTAIGGIGGAIAAPVTAGISRLISPRSSESVQRLLGEGVTPTPGQVLGGGFKAAEEKLSSVPLLGSAIKTGQQRAVEQFDRAAFNRALSPVGEALPKGVLGREAVNYVDDVLGKKYDTVLSKIGAQPIDNQLLTELGNLKQLLRNQPKQVADRLDDILSNELLGRTQNGYLTSDAIKAAESQIGRIAKGFQRSQDYDTQVLGNALDESVRSLRGWLQRVAPQDAAEELAKVNAGWANFKRVQRAAAALGAEEGVFSPAQLQSAVKALDRSKDKARFAEGNALMQDLSEAGKSVLSPKVPNSGTVDRALASAAALGPLAGGAISPALPLAAIPSLMYAPGMQRVMASILAGRQQAPFRALSQGLLTSSPAVGAALTPAFEGLLQ